MTAHKLPDMEPMIDRTARDGLEAIAMRIAADVLTMAAFDAMVEPLLAPDLSYDARALVADVGRRIAQCMRNEGVS